MEVLALLDPTDGVREAVEGELGPVLWADDGDRRAWKDADAVLSFWPRGELARAGISWDDLPAARVLQMATAGANHVPWDEVPERVSVATTPGATAPSVSEHVLLGLLWFARRVWRHDRDIRAGRFQNGAPVRALHELKVGIVGYGGIGQAVAKRCLDTGCGVRAISQSGILRDGAPQVPLASWDGLADMVAWADALVLCLPLHVETEGCIDAEVLRLLDGERLLVNVARGAIVDEVALYDWLAASQDHAAVLDVWWRYPRRGRPFRKPFHRLQNVLMSPHNAPNVTGFKAGMAQAAARQLARYRDTGDLENVEDRGAYRLRGDGDGR